MSSSHETGKMITAAIDPHVMDKLTALNGDLQEIGTPFEKIFKFHKSSQIFTILHTILHLSSKQIVALFLAGNKLVSIQVSTPQIQSYELHFIAFYVLGRCLYNIRYVSEILDIYIQNQKRE